MLLHVDPDEFIATLAEWANWDICPVSSQLKLLVAQLEADSWDLQGWKLADGGYQVAAATES